MKAHMVEQIANQAEAPPAPSPCGECAAMRRLPDSAAWRGSQAQTFARGAGMTAFDDRLND